MRIKTFGNVLETEEAQDCKLQNEAVVLDGHNFFFQTYEQSGLAFELGCESHQYAAYLADRLAMFHKANIQCYILFKGGWTNFDDKIDSEHEKAFIKRPIFTKNIIKEVLNDLNFQFIFCEYESKNDIIELAQTLDCPIISWDLEYCFAGHRYISIPTLEYNERDNSIHCRVFQLSDFLKTEDKIATFIVLTDTKIYPEGFFAEVYKLILNGHVFGVRKRNKFMLEWLSRNKRDQIWRTISRLLSVEERKNFLEKEAKARLLIGRKHVGGFGAACSLDRGAACVERADPCWFVKGVASAHIDQEYVNLYHYKRFYGSKAIADNNQDDAMIPSLEIVKYALDLLTNFRNDGFKFDYDTEDGKQTMIVGDTHSITKPACEAAVSVFENGWGTVRELGLLEHFLRSTLQLDSLARVERAPERTRLLLLALAYCSHRRPAAPAGLPAAVLLTHVVLDVITQNQNNNLPNPPFEKRPLLDSTTNRSDVTEIDCGVAAAIMKPYFNVTDIDVKLLHPLVEYQQCVAQLSALNVLCGCEVPAPVFARSYSGTLAYSLLRGLERAADRTAFLDGLLSPAPTVYAYFNGIYEAYEDLLFVEAHEEM